MYFLYNYVRDIEIRSLQLHKKFGPGFIQWYRICAAIYDARRAFWIISVVFLSIIFAFYGLFKLLICIYMAYERSQGRIYG